MIDLRVSVTGGVHFDLVKRVLRDIQRVNQDPEEIIHQISETVWLLLLLLSFFISLYGVHSSKRLNLYMIHAAFFCEQVYPMYKAFIEPDLQTAHIKITNKFNPFSGFQNPTYVLKVIKYLYMVFRLKGCTKNLDFSCYHRLSLSECIFFCSLRRGSHRIRSRLFFLRNTKKPTKKHMIFFCCHRVKIPKLANRIWGWGTGMADTLSCLRYAASLLIPALKLPVKKALVFNHYRVSLWFVNVPLRKDTIVYHTL